MPTRLAGLLLLMGCATTKPERQVAAEPAPAPIVRAPTPTLRLPNDVRPTSYEISATVIPHEATMHAVTTIAMSLSARTDRIWLNQTELRFGACSATFEGKTVSATAKPEKAHFVAIDLSQPIGPGEATLTLDTTAPLSRRENQGAFVATEDGEAYVYTQFESLGARRVFPVFDEPSFKVPWTLSLRVPKALSAVSNTAVSAEREDGEYKVVTFEKTKPIPSYLLAFGVGPFDFVDGGFAGQNHVPVRIIVPQGQGPRAAWAADMTKQIIERLEAYFGLPFPYAKADQLAVAVPGFGGAMENPGLITYGHALLVAQSSGDTLARKRRFVSVAAHELAHQWFGDMVTAAWWDDIWLNESFATFVENQLLTEWLPDWGGAIERVEVRDEAMSEDSLASARRIREPIVTNDDIVNAFDGITYEKGASVLHMVEQWVGKDVFRAGVKSYLQTHAWKNATAKDFLDAIGRAAGRDVSGPFNTFLEQPGFPIITATMSCPQGANPILQLAQERYAPLGTKVEPATWMIPVCVRWPAGRQCALLDSPTSTIELQTASCPAWLLANEGMHGYYRVRPVAPALANDPALTLEERVGLAGDVSALVARGELSAADELAQFAGYFKSGRRQLMTNALWPMRNYQRLLPSSARGQVSAYVKAQFGPKAKEVGFYPKDGEPDDVRLLRPSLMRVVGVVGQDRGVQAEAVKQVKAWLARHDAVSPEVIGVALGIAGSMNDPKLFDQVLAAVQVEPDRRARQTMMGFFGSTTDAKLVARALEAALKTNLDPREATGLWWSFAGNSDTAGVVFDFLKANYDGLVTRLPEEWASGLVTIGTATCDAKRREEVATFFGPRMASTLGGPRALANALESMDQCIAWRARQVPEIVRFFAKAKQ